MKLIQSKQILKVGEIIKAKFKPAFSEEVEILGRIREFKGSMICCNQLISELPFFCLAHEAVKIDLPETVVISLGEVA